MQRNAPPFAAWCDADPGPILPGGCWIPALRSSARALHRVRDTRSWVMLGRMRQGLGLDDIEVDAAAAGAAHGPVFGARPPGDDAQHRQFVVALRAGG